MDTYTEWLLAQGLDPRTARIYRGKLVKATEVADEQGWDIRHMTPSQLGVITAAFPQSASTIRLLRTALTHYWMMCGVDNPARAIRPPKPPDYQYRGLDPEQATLLERTAQDWWPRGTAVLLGLYLALRREEIATLRWEMFDTGLEWVTVMGKGRKTRELPVHPSLIGELAPRQGVGYMFPGRDRACVHTATVRVWVGQVAVAAGLGTLAPHQLRHTCLATMNDETGDLRVTQYFAGHTNPQTTALYTRATKRRLLAAVQSIDYRAA